MEFLSNRDVLAAFEAIVTEGQELGTEGSGEADDDDSGKAPAPESGAEITGTSGETEGRTENADIS